VFDLPALAITGSNDFSSLPSGNECEQITCTPNLGTDSSTPELETDCNRTRKCFRTLIAGHKITMTLSAKTGSFETLELLLVEHCKEVSLDCTVSEQRFRGLEW
jgi:hypothetical protein